VAAPPGSDAPDVRLAPDVLPGAVAHWRAVRQR
jgi:hypothetical protein